MKITFEVPGSPCGKGRARAFRRGNYIGHYTPEKTVNYENFIKLCYMEKTKNIAQKITEKPIALSVVAVMQIPSAFSKTKHKQALEGQLKPLNKPDVDNICKAVCDALNKIAYFDDKQIVILNAKKIYGNEPKLIIELEEIE